MTGLPMRASGLSHKRILREKNVKGMEYSSGWTAPFMKDGFKKIARLVEDA